MGLRFFLFCRNDVIALSRTVGRLDDNCDVYLHHNPDLLYAEVLTREDRVSGTSCAARDGFINY